LVAGVSAHPDASIIFATSDSSSIAESDLPANDGQITVLPDIDIGKYVEATPTFVLVDSHRRVQHVWTGFQKTEDQVEILKMLQRKQGGWFNVNRWHF
jgi:hypothetical protein